MVTTENADGSVNIAPMGPTFAKPKDGQSNSSEVQAAPSAWAPIELRPFPGSKTFANLTRTRRGVFHVTDNAMLLAQSAIDRWVSPCKVSWRSTCNGWLIDDACRWWAFEVTEMGPGEKRRQMSIGVTDSGILREWNGWNRGQFAVLELAILATRKHFTPAEFLLSEIERLRPLIEKTGGPCEHEAFLLLTKFLNETNAA